MSIWLLVHQSAILDQPVKQEDGIFFFERSNKQTWKKRFHSHSGIPWYHNLSHAPSNQTELHTACRTAHTSTSYHHVFSSSASLYQLNHLVREMGDDAHMSALDRRTPSFLCLHLWYYSFVWASTVDCGLFGVTGGFGLVGTLCCRFRTHTGSLSLGFLETRLPLQHLDLI
jgi:hypothetical protein